MALLPFVALSVAGVFTVLFSTWRKKKSQEKDDTIQCLAVGAHAASLNLLQCLISQIIFSAFCAPSVHSVSLYWIVTKKGH